MNKPRRFYLSPIYVDERSERLAALERGEYRADHLRQAFRQARRARRTGPWLWAPALLAALALILIIGVLLFL